MSDSEYDSDCDVLMALKFLNYGYPAGPRQYLPRVDLINRFSDEQFNRRFRLNKETVVKLFEDVQEALTPNTMRNNAVAPINKLLMTLRYFATGSFMSELADFSGVGQSSARRFITSTIWAIAQQRPKYVSFPRDFTKIKKRFYDLTKMPNVLMVIDCTHVRILSPGGENAEVFRNINGYYSLIVQAVCDADLRIMDCTARWGGSTHDQHIFDSSRLMHRIASGEFGNGVIIGDSGYENRPYFLTPLNAARTRGEKLYNESINRARNVTKKCFEVWKKRFPVLSSGIRSNLQQTMATIQAAAVLHNLALNDFLPPPDANVTIESYEAAKIAVQREKASEGPSHHQEKLISEYFDKL